MFADLLLVGDGVAHQSKMLHKVALALEHFTAQVDEKILAGLNDRADDTEIK
jgi:hypothetical protein